MAVARQIVVNPANKTQRYILYTNGYVQAVGGAIQPTMQDASVNTFSTSQGPPLWSQGVEPAKAIQVLDWSVPKGYTLDGWGNIWPWGGANPVAGQTAPLTGGPEYYIGLNGGFPTPYGYVADFYMDPSGGGTGYYLLYDGQVVSVGTGVTTVPRVANLGGTGARRLIMDWTSKRYWILDNLGRISGYNGGNSPTIVSASNIGSYSYSYPGYVWGVGGNQVWGNFTLYDLSANPKGWMIDSKGRVWRVGGAQDPVGFEYDIKIDQWSDIAIIDDGTGANPLRLVQLTQQGRQNEFVVSTAPVAAVNEPTGTFSAANKPWVGWQYIDKEGDAQSAYEVRILQSSVYLSGTTNEVQSIATTGAPTGGTFRLGFQRSANAPIASTTTIAYNASAATVQAALEALPNIGTGGVVCAGGPLGTAAISITFQNQMAGWDWPVLTLFNNSLTGGTTPTVTRSTTTNGVGVNPAAVANIWNTAGNDTTTRVRSTTELPNTTTFRAFVRSTDTAGMTGAWDYSQFATAYTALSTPTVTPAVLGGIAGIQLNVAAATGAGLPGTARFGVQFSDDTGTTWYNVRNGDALVPDGSGKANVVDIEAPFAKSRMYRAVTYVYDAVNDLWQQSPWSATANATLTGTMWALTNPFNSAQALAIKLESFETVQKVMATKFFATNRADPIVLSDGPPKYPSIELNIWSFDATTRAEIELLCNANVTLQLRNFWGESWYIRMDDEFRRSYLRAAPLASESTPLRDAKTIKVTTQAVKRPVAGPTTGPLAEAA